MNRVLLFAVLLLIVLTARLSAVDIELKNGKIYKNVLIIKESESTFEISVPEGSIIILKSDIYKITLNEYKKEEKTEIIKPDDEIPAPVIYDLSYHGPEIENSIEQPVKPKEQTFSFFSVTVSFSDVVNVGGVMGGDLNKYGMGYYLAYKSNLSGIDDDDIYDFNYNTAKYTYSDREGGVTKGYSQFSLGAHVPVIKNFISILIGLSYQESSQLVNFYDNSYSLGNNGSYYVYKENISGIGFEIGASIKIGPIGFTYMYSTGNVNTTMAGINFYW